MGDLNQHKSKLIFFFKYLNVGEGEKARIGVKVFTEYRHSSDFAVLK